MFSSLSESSFGELTERFGTDHISCFRLRRVSTLWIQIDFSQQRRLCYLRGIILLSDIDDSSFSVKTLQGQRSVNKIVSVPKVKSCWKCFLPFHNEFTKKVNSRQPNCFAFDEFDLNPRLSDQWREKLGKRARKVNPRWVRENFNRSGQRELSSRISSAASH